MAQAFDLNHEASVTLDRLTPRLRDHLAAVAPDASWGTFARRLDHHFAPLFAHLFALYGRRYDFTWHLEQWLCCALDRWADRPAELLELDRRRLDDPGWFERQTMLGGVCYVDRFAGDLDGLRRRLPYLEELGLTYLHLMPPYAVPERENDGGYAVSDYRAVDPRLGTIDQLRRLAAALRRRGISLVLDLVFNHTSDEHRWARRAQGGDPEFSAYYRMFDTREQTEAYAATLREIFPDRAGGSFTYDERSGRWVWTTFNRYQWDLNYENPAVFGAMLDEMLTLANLGVEVLRMDAVAFVWKRVGTDCENLPGAHHLLRAYNRMLALCAPAVLLKSEAIVHPDRVAEYIHPDECALSYNPLLMALLWESLATRKVALLRQALATRHALPRGCAWVNYVRCHDDIGWTFSDEDAAALGINGFDHRRFLNDFYTGRFSGSFARGLPFGHNPNNGDCRIAGTLASLAGLEKALSDGDLAEQRLSVARILLLHGLILSAGGIPLIYLGDETATLNDYSYAADPSLAADARWVHRPKLHRAAEDRGAPNTPQSQVFLGIKRLIEARRACPALAGNRLTPLSTENQHVLGFVRRSHQHRLVVLASFSEHRQTVPTDAVRLGGGAHRYRDLVSGDELSLDETLTLEPYRLCWLSPV